MMRRNYRRGFVHTSPGILLAIHQRLAARFRPTTCGALPPSGGRANAERHAQIGLRPIPQVVGWWPAEGPFEVAVGAILTQRTAWRNVEAALAHLRRAGMLSPRRLARAPLRRLQSWIRPAGFYRQKAPRVRAFARYLVAHHQGNLTRWLRGPLLQVRQELLALPGVGPETADSILLYAGGRPSLVVDAYTHRILSRHGLVPPGLRYEALQQWCVERLPRRRQLYDLFHALVVEVGKRYCRARPHCRHCPLNVFPLAKSVRSVD